MVHEPKLTHYLLS